MRRFQNILIVCTGDSADARILERVAELATRNSAKITLFQVIDNSAADLARYFSGVPGRQGTSLAQDVIAEHRAHVKTLAETLEGQGLKVDYDIAAGTEFIEIVRRVLLRDHDLVVKSAANGSSPFLPSQDMHLMRKCPCPVWIFNGQSEIRPRRILAAIDPDGGSDATEKETSNRTIMQLATSMAEWCDARLDVLSVWRLPEEYMLRHSRISLPPHEVDILVEQERVAAEARVAKLMTEFPEFTDRIRVLNLKGLAAETIVDHADAEEVDLVVMGTLGRSGVAGLLIGNTAETVLSQVKCSVLTIKPQGFVTPVAID